MNYGKNLTLDRSVRRIIGLVSILTLLGTVACRDRTMPSDEDYQIAEGDKITLIDTNVEPALTGDGYLHATLQDGRQVKLPIRSPASNGADPAAERPDCTDSVYLEIGSLTYVKKKLAANPDASLADQNLWRQEVDQRREALKSTFLSRYTSNEGVDPEEMVVNCNLELQPDDEIHMRLIFKGPQSSNLKVTCLEGANGGSATIENPATTTMLKNKGSEPAMLTFLPSGCGIVPLEEDPERYIDELGAVASRCDPVRDVEINGCRIRGRTTARSFKDNLFKLSMVRADHVKRLRESAAQHITFSDVKITGRYRGPVHFLPGVHHVTIEDSEVHGGFINMTIHLPADGGWNIIKNNKISGQRKTASDERYLGQKREVISIDASEHNRIVNNHFTRMPYGAIELYRNCGERNDIRHRIPQYNQIINNVFDYAGHGSNNHTIRIGARDDISMAGSLGFGVKRYCHKDQGRNGERFTGNDRPEAWDTSVVRNSSESNSDWAENNVIADNQVISKNVSYDWAFHLSSKAKRLDNYLINNEVVHDRSTFEALRIQKNRGAGCAVLAGITDGMLPPYMDDVRNGNIPYIRNETSIAYFWDIRPEVLLQCGTTPLRCSNNILQADSSQSCEELLVYDYGSQAQECHAENNVCAEGDNTGDEEVLGCPDGGHLLAVQAACNLEYGKAEDAQRKKILLNHIKVVKPSDNISDGLCTADETELHQGQGLILPWVTKRYDATSSPGMIEYTCKEHDRNGGECHVNIRHYCLPPEPLI